MRRHADQGAALILVVLMTLLLLAGLLVTTMKLGLSSRQTTSDQARTLAAQYAAESSLAAARSRLRDIQDILSSNRINIQATFGLMPDEVKQMADRWCNVAPNQWSATSDFVTSNPNNSYPQAQQCTFVPTGGALPASQFDVLARLVDPGAYALLPGAERPGNAADENSRKNWWKTTLSDLTTQTSGNGRKVSQYRVQPLRAVQLNRARYRFYIGVVSMTNNGSQSASSRVLQGRNSSLGMWYFELNANLNTDVLMTNHHRMKTTDARLNLPPDVNFVSQVFDGSVHTNEKFLFMRNATAQFLGMVTSAGCTDLPLSGAPSSNSCTQVAGVNISGAAPFVATQGDKAAKNAAIRAVIDQNTDVTFMPPTPTEPVTADFTAGYRALPTNANDQRAAAQQGGLLLDNTAFGVDLFAGDASGQPLTTYNTSTSKWTEPNPTYQYIRVYTNSGGQAVIDPQRSYRVDQNGQMQRRNPNTGAWVNQGSFNGVIYGQTLGRVTGPTRTGNQDGNNLATVRPALASFSKITLAAQGDIRIDTDLAMSDTPCTNAQYRLNTCQKSSLPPENILGIYSQGGDILFTGNTPNNLNIHASLMASSGEVKAENHNGRPVQGSINMIGSLVENWYGAFGTVNGTAQATGYSRNFTYDPRLRQGYSPPAWAISSNWQATDARSNGEQFRLDDLLWTQVAKP